MNILPIYCSKLRNQAYLHFMLLRGGRGAFRAVVRIRTARTLPAITLEVGFLARYAQRRTQFSVIFKTDLYCNPVAKEASSLREKSRYSRSASAQFESPIATFRANVRANRPF